MPFGHIVSAIARTGDASHLFATPKTEEPAVDAPEGGEAATGATGGGGTAPVEETVSDGGDTAPVEETASDGGDTAALEGAAPQVGEPDLEGELLEILEEGVDLVA